MNRLQIFAPMIPIMTGAVSLLNIANARGFDRGFHAMGFARGFFSLLMMLLIFALLALALYYLIQQLRHSKPSLLSSTPAPSVPGSDNALVILRERLAKGEIELEDYEARRRVLLNE